MSKINRVLTKQLSFSFNASPQAKRLAQVFFVFLLIFESFAFQTEFLKFFDYLNGNQDFVFAAVCFLHLLLSFYLSFVFLLVAFGSKRRYAVVYFLIFAFSTFYQYGYQKALGKFTDIGDVIVALSATDQQRFDSIAAFLSFSALIPCAVYILLALRVKSSERQFGGKHLLLTIAVLCPLYLYISFVNQSFIGQRFPNVSFGAFCQTAADVVHWRTFLYVSPPARRLIEKPPLPENYIPANNIVFIFDETVRGDHLSLNGYTRPTTPYLEELAAKNLLKNWGVAVSSATSSHPSYDAMITGITPDLLEQSRQENNSRPNIFQYAKAMNYKTYLLDGQMKSYWGGIPDDLKYIDRFVTLKDIDERIVEDWEVGDRIKHEIINDGRPQTWEIDDRLAKMVNEIFSRSTGNFIFVYKRGNHFPYEKNYPAEETFYKPVYYFSKQYEIPPAEKRQEIINSYDNSIRYNTDRFFRNLAADYAALPNNTVIVYTGDHGESFFENQKAAHGGTTRDEANVPLFMLGNLPKEPDVNYKASHSNIFPTLLDLMNYPENLRKEKYALSLLNAASKDSTRRFFNPYFGEKIPFD